MEVGLIEHVLLVFIVSLGEIVDNSLVCTKVSLLASLLRSSRWQLLTKIFTSKMSVTGSRLDFEHAVVNSQERDIEGSSSKIVDDDLTLISYYISPG